MAATAKIIPLPRKASRDQRRQQLIDATIDTIARQGYAQTTLAEVAATAGVSHGLVNFHFTSKDRLLTETLLHLADEYRNNWMAALAGAPANPAAQLQALILADFAPLVCEPRKLVAWCAFWGEAQSRPLYQEKCGANDLAHVHMMEDICESLNLEGNYGLDAARAARILRVTVEGVWLDLMAAPAPYSREEALQTVYLAAAALFPKHFTTAGIILTPA